MSTQRSPVDGDTGAVVPTEIGVNVAVVCLDTGERIVCTYVSLMQCNFCQHDRGA